MLVNVSWEPPYSLSVLSTNNKAVFFITSKPFDIVFLCKDRQGRQGERERERNIQADGLSTVAERIAKNDTAVHLVV